MKAVKLINTVVKQSCQFIRSNRGLRIFIRGDENDAFKLFTVMSKKVKRTGLKSEQVSIKNLEIMQELCIALKQIDRHKMVSNQYWNGSVLPPQLC